MPLHHFWLLFWLLALLLLVISCLDEDCNPGWGIAAPAFDFAQDGEWLFSFVHWRLDYDWTTRSDSAWSKKTAGGITIAVAQSEPGWNGGWEQ